MIFKHIIHMLEKHIDLESKEWVYIKKKKYNKSANIEIWLLKWVK